MKKILLLLALLLIPTQAMAAISGSAVWDVRSTADASNINGGFFVTGASGVDYSKQNSAQYALTGVTSAGAGNTILTASAATNMVGNGIHTVSGTNFTNNAWFEITSVVAGVSITCSTNAAGASISTGVGATGVMNVGGAISLGTSGSSGDDDVFEAMAPGNKVYVKSGTYIIGEAVSVALSGTGTLPILVEGYNATQGDNPALANWPLFANAATGFVWSGDFWVFRNINITSTNTTSGMTIDLSSRIENFKIILSTTTANIPALSMLAGNASAINGDAVSYRGRAISSGNNAGFTIDSVYGHDSDIGFRFTNSGIRIMNSVSADNVSQSVATTVNVTDGSIRNNTFAGAVNKLGTGFNFLTGTTRVEMLNNILWGFTTAVTHADNQTYGLDDYNNYYNNTADVSSAAQWKKGPNDLAVDPSFTSVSQVVNSGSVTAGAADNTITDTTQNFTTAGVVAGRDYFYLVSGTNCTPGKYGITSVGTTTLVLDLDPTSSSTGSSIVYQITVGQNYAVGTNLKAVGSPRTFGSTTSSYVDIGGVQRQESGGTNILGVIQ